MCNFTTVINKIYNNSFSNVSGVSLNWDWRHISASRGSIYVKCKMQAWTFSNQSVNNIKKYDTVEKRFLTDLSKLFIQSKHVVEKIKKDFERRIRRTGLNADIHELFRIRRQKREESLQEYLLYLTE